MRPATTVTTSRSASDARRARRGDREIPRHVRSDAAGVLREEHRRRAIVRPRAQGQDRRRSTRPEGRGRHREAARDPVVRRRDGAARDAGHRRLLRALAGARPRRGARVRRGPAALRRTRSGEFGLDRAVPLADVLQGAARVAGRAAGPVPGAAARAAVGDAALGDASWSASRTAWKWRPATSSRRSPTLPRSSGCSARGRFGGLARPGKTSGCWVLTAIWWVLAKPSKNLGFLHGWVVLG